MSEGNTDYTSWLSAWKEDTFDHSLPHPNIERKIRETLSRYVPENGHILDFGAGTGNARYLPENFDQTHIHAVDFSPDALAKNPAGKKTVANILEAIDNPNKYDLVMIMFVLSSFSPEDQLRIIKNALQHIKPDGNVIAVDFERQISLSAAKMYTVSVEELKTQLQAGNHDLEVVSENIYPKFFDDEDGTEYSPIHMLRVHQVPESVTSEAPLVQAPRQDS